MGNEPTTPKTQEQLDAEKFLTDAGLHEGTTVLDEGAQPIPGAAPEPPTPPEPPAATPPAATPPAPTPTTVSVTEAELAALRKRAEWADHEKERADRFREQVERESAENQRLRQALGVPTPPKKRELTEEEQKGLDWLDRTIDPDFLARKIKSLPEGALAGHPDIVKRDVRLGMLRDENDQLRFLGEFTPKERKVIKARILPSLAQRRQATGYQKTYEELWEDDKQAAKEAAEVYGLVLGGNPPATPPAPAPTVVPVVPVPPPPALRPVPPSVLGVPGSSSSPTTPTTPYSAEELRVMGLADGPFNQ